MTDLLLIRHGQATHNRGGRTVGRESTPLTEEGWHQAQAQAGRLALWSPPIAHLYTSPQKRAQQTADSIGRALGVVPVLDDRLQGFGFGRVRGLRPWVIGGPIPWTTLPLRTCALAQGSMCWLR